MPFGLSEDSYNRIKDVIASFSKIDEAVIFGSRARNVEKIGSDVDIAIKGKNIDSDYTLKVAIKLDDLELLYKFDVVNYSKLKSSDSIKKSIDKYGAVFYKKEKVGEKWKKYQLSELCDDIAMGPFGSNLKVDNFIDKGVPVIRGSNLNDRGLINDSFVFVSEKKANSLKRCLAFPDDLVFTHRGTLGQVVIIPKGKYEKYLVSQSQMRLTVNKKYLVPKYLYYFFKSPLGQSELLKNATQVGVPAIANPTKSLKAVELSIPNIDIQKEIASILSSIDDRIELNQQINQTLEDTARAIFKEWFVNFNFPGFDGKLVNGLPKGWRKGSILEVADLLSGGTPRTDCPNYWNGNINWLSAKDISANNRTFILSTEKHISEDGLTNSATKLLPQYTTVITARGTVGNYCILSSEMAISQSNYGLKSKNNNNFYVYLLVESMIEMMKQYSYGTVFDTITTKTFKEMEISIPPNSLIDVFEKNVNSVFEKRLLLTQDNYVLTQICDRLLPKLVTGKIEVSA
jgi:type I restriction enzyme S subunit